MKTGKFLAVQLIYYLVVIFYALWQADHPALNFLRPRKQSSAPRRKPTGRLTVLVYFYQLAQHAVPDGFNKLASGVSTKLGQISGGYSASLFSTSSGTCIVRSMSATAKLVWRLFNPLVLLAVLFSVLFFRTVAGRCLKKRRRKAAAELSEEGLRDSLIDDKNFLFQANDSNTHSDTDHEDALAPPMEHEQQQRLADDEARAMAKAAACLILFSFSDLSFCTLELLDCVDLRDTGHQRVLFSSGNLACSITWQWPIFCLLVLILALPCYPVAVWLLQQQQVFPASWRLVSWARRQKMSGLPVAQEIKVFACEPFTPSCWHWAPLQALQRFLTVMCVAFATGEATTAVGVAIVSIWFLVFQLQAHPYQNRGTNMLQLVASMSLVFICVLSAVSSVFTDIGFEPEGTPLDTVRNSLDVAMFLMLLPPLVAYPILARYCSSNEGTEAHVDADATCESRQTEPCGDTLLRVSKDERDKDTLLARKEVEIEKAAELLVKERLRHKDELKQVLVAERRRHEEEKAQLVAQHAQELPLPLPPLSELKERWWKCGYENGHLSRANGAADGPYCSPVSPAWPAWCGCGVAVVLGGGAAPAPSHTRCVGRFFNSSG
jgi:hypothetical protein